MMRLIALAAIAALPLVLGAPSASAPGVESKAAPDERAAKAGAIAKDPFWPKRVVSARAYAKGRAGRVAFAVVHQGRLRGGYHLDELHSSASLVKAMLLVAYLDHPRVRGRALGAADRRLVGPMIKWSDNAAASRVYAMVGPGGLARLGRRAGLSRLGVSVSSWSRTRLTARDQARFFSRFDQLTPSRHRPFARALLAKITPPHRWGIPPTRPRGWRIFFKGGWRREAGGRLVNQAALVKRGRQRIAIAVLGDGAPSMAYATATIEGVARRLLRGADRLRTADR